MRRISTSHVALAVLLLSLVPQLAQAQQHVVIPGKVVTGFNRYLDRPFIDFGAPLGTLNFAALGQQGSGGATPLTGATPNSALLTTTLDPTYLGQVGLNPALVDPTLLNVPLRDVRTNIFADRSLRLPLPGSDEVGVADAAQHGSATPVDLATWREARGALEIECNGPDSGSFLLRARNLLPNRLYSVWGHYLRPDFPVGTPPIQATAIGGLPNAFVSDDAGQGTFERALNGCPLMADEFGRQLLAVDLIFHSDHQLVGTVPAVPLTGGGLGVGTVAHPQLAFNIAGTDLLTPEGWGDRGTCLPSSTKHCFQDGRFQVEIDWTNFSNQSGSGLTDHCGSDNAGSFYFFDPDNLEALVKVLDGCSFNNHFWVFASLATDVEYTLTVTDTQSSQTKIYSNPLGQASEAITDTQAFATCP